MAGIRDQKKAETRHALKKIAIELFREKGFDQTTVDEIAERKGISTRTFHRYFAGKEEVLFGDWRGLMEMVSEAIAERPAEESLLEAFSVVVGQVFLLDEGDRQQMLFGKRLARSSKEVGQFEKANILPALHDAVTEAFGRRLGDIDDEKNHASLAAGIAISIMQAAKQRWLDGDGKIPYKDLMEESLLLARSLFDDLGSADGAGLQAHTTD